MRLNEFDYELPERLIAQYPMEKRDESRLLVVNRERRNFEHRKFKDILDLISERDVLVINDTKVIPARLFGKKESGGKAEVLILRRLPSSEPEGNGESNVWQCLIKSSKRPKDGSIITFNERLEGEVIQESQDGKYVIRFRSDGDFHTVLDKIGTTPLPPYIKRNRSMREGAKDRERYQTVFAKNRGSVAAPTAGFHFTEGLISNIRERGLRVVPITVHIGLGTFMPIRMDNIENHAMEEEFFEIMPEAAVHINESTSQGGRVIAVGTSATRALESAVVQDKRVKAGSGYTALFIYPGYQFKIVDVLITNFHLPKSTPMLLVSAFAGKALIEESYRRAIKAEYRFLSYGDGMMIL